MKFFAFLLSAFFLTGCFTPSKEKKLNEDIFALQTRLLQLEGNVTETNKSGTQRVASSSSEMERINMEVKRMQGEMDALRVGVKTGQLPGTTEPSENTVAGKLESLSERIDGIEAAQEELLLAIEKSGALKGKKGKDKANAADKPSLSSVKELQQAFDKKKFKVVANDGPSVIRKAKGAEKEQAMFIHSEALFKLGRVKEAAIGYDEFIKAKPDKKFLPVAKMRLGDAFRHLGDQSVAKIYYEELVNEYPGTPEAEKAKERLATFKTPEQKKNTGAEVPAAEPSKEPGKESGMLKRKGRAGIASRV